MALSPASIRNVMSDLEHLGFIYAPHTSAGRLPTEMGLRMFVDGLLELGDLSDDERRKIEAQIGIKREQSLEQVLTEAGEMISGLSHCAGVVLTDKQRARIKHIEFVQLEPGKALVVLVGDDRTSRTASSTCRRASPRRACRRPPTTSMRACATSRSARPGRASRAS